MEVDLFLNINLGKEWTYCGFTSQERKRLYASMECQNVRYVPRVCKNAKSEFQVEKRCRIRGFMGAHVGNKNAYLGVSLLLVSLCPS